MKELTYQDFKQKVTINTHGKAFSATFKDSGREYSANGESENWAILNLMEYLRDEWGYAILEDQNYQTPALGTTDTRPDQIQGRDKPVDNDNQYQEWLKNTKEQAAEKYADSVFIQLSPSNPNKAAITNSARIDFSAGYEFCADKLAYQPNPAIADGSQWVSVEEQDNLIYSIIDNVEVTGIAPSGSVYAKHKVVEMMRELIKCCPVICKSEWISVSKQLPSIPDESYIIAVKNKNKEGGIWLIDMAVFGSDGQWQKSNVWETVLFWQTLPSDPGQYCPVYNPAIAVIEAEIAECKRLEFEGFNKVRLQILNKILKQIKP